MQVAVLILMAGVVGVLIYTLTRLRKSDFSLLANRMARKSRDSFQVLRPCPLCATMLRKGETLHSVVYSAASGGDASGGLATGGDSVAHSGDTLAHLFGCPYCYPANNDHPRRCPVCREVIPAEGYVVARMFEKPGRKHVHVLGCTLCRIRGRRR